MKKLTLSLVVLLLCGLGYAQFLRSSIPTPEETSPPSAVEQEPARAVPRAAGDVLFENFDAGTALPEGWSVIGFGAMSGANYEWKINESTSAYPSSTGTGNYANSQNGNYRNSALITPAIEIPAEGDFKLAFLSRLGAAQDGSILTEYDVKISTTGNDTIVKFDQSLGILKVRHAVPTWNEVEMSLAAYKGQTVHIAFVFGKDNGRQQPWWVDDVTVKEGTVAIPDYTINITAPTGGSISVKNGETDVTDGTAIAEDTELTLTATAEATHKFVKWMDDNTEATRTFTVTGDATIAAEFKELPKPITEFPWYEFFMTDIDKADLWTVLGNDANRWGYSQYGAGNTPGIYQHGSGGTNTDNALITPAFTLPAEADNYTLSFTSKIQAGQTLGSCVVKISTTGNDDLAKFTAVNNVTLNTDGNLEIIEIPLTSYAGQTIYVAFHYTGIGGYQSQTWDIDDIIIKDGAVTYPITITQPETGFGEIEVSYMDAGFSIPVTSGESIALGTTLNLSATTEDGYKFVKWWDDAIGTTKTYVVTGPVAISAEIVKIPEYTVTIPSMDNGTVVVMNGTTPVNSGDKVLENTSLDVISKPNLGSKFIKWWDNATLTTQITASHRAITVNSDTTLSVTFEVVTPAETKTAPWNIDFTNAASLNDFYVYGFGGNPWAVATNVSGATNTAAAQSVAWVPGARNSILQVMYTPAIEIPAEGTYKLFFTAAYGPSGAASILADNHVRVMVGETSNGYDYTTYTEVFDLFTDKGDLPASTSFGSGGVNGRAFTRSLDVFAGKTVYIAFVKELPVGFTTSNQPVFRVDQLAVQELVSVNITTPTDGNAISVKNGDADVADGDLISKSTELNLVATPATGYKFVKWLMDDNTETSRTFTVTEAVTIAAEFAEIPIPVLTLPYREGFAAGIEGWTIEKVAGSGNWTHLAQGIVRHGGTPNAQTALISPRIAIPAEGDYKLQFASTIGNVAAVVDADNLRVMITTENSTDLTDFTKVYNIRPGNASRQDDWALLNDFRGENIRMAFVYDERGGKTDITWM
ncbi:MAG: choice-of-anchor J domain-containing protein, partial [Bacteroidales bacterium]|nr:choice-of-anchor J domain-containing protein [Bacteroidales bacterium]